MIRIVVAVLGLILTFSPCQSQRKTQRNTTGEQVIKRLERELEAALLKGDRAVLGRLVADDYIEINAQGNVSTKADLLALASARNSPSRGISVGPEKSVDDLTIRVHGDSAVVSGRTTIRYQFMNYQTTPGASNLPSPVTVDQERFIRTYAKVGRLWRLVAWQTTTIAKR
jgi:hypothetical protein